MNIKVKRVIRGVDVSENDNTKIHMAKPKYIFDKNKIGEFEGYLSQDKRIPLLSKDILERDASKENLEQNVNDLN